MPLDPRAIIAGGENAKTEFKRDDLTMRPERLAREIVAFANMNGGVIVIGVEDDGAVTGVTGPNLQAWLMDTVIGRFIDPQIVPDYDEFRLDDKQIAIVTVPAGTAKPYAVRLQDRTDYYIRLGDTVQRAGREQMARLFQSGGLVSVEKMPVHGSSLADLDMRRLEDYFLTVLGEEAVADWRRTLLNRELLVADEWRIHFDDVASLDVEVRYAVIGERGQQRLDKQAVKARPTQPVWTKPYRGISVSAFLGPTVPVAALVRA